MGAKQSRQKAAKSLDAAEVESLRQQRVKRPSAADITPEDFSLVARTKPALLQAAGYDGSILALAHALHESYLRLLVVGPSRGGRDARGAAKRRARLEQPQHEPNHR